MAHGFPSVARSPGGSELRPARFLVVAAALLVAVLTAVPACANPLAYIANFGDGTVLVIDTATQAVVATVAGGRSPPASR